MLLAAFFHKGVKYFLEETSEIRIKITKYNFMTLHIAEILSKYKNAQAWVSIVSYFEKIEKIKIIKGKKS